MPSRLPRKSLRLLAVLSLALYASPASAAIGAAKVVAFALITAALIAAALFGALIGKLIGGRRGGVAGLMIGPVALLVAVAVKVGTHDSPRAPEKVATSLRQPIEKDERLGDAGLPAKVLSIPADSLLIESGYAKEGAIHTLLGDQGLRFVELQAVRMPALPGEAQSQWGVKSGESFFLLPRPENLLRLSLGKQGDPACTDQRDFGLDNDRRELPPFAPEACIRVEVATVARATHALRAVPHTDQQGVPCWSLVDRSSGASLLSPATRDDPDAPRNAGSGNGTRAPAFGAAACSSVEADVTSLLIGSPPAGGERLAFMRHTVKAEAISAELGSGQWPMVKATAALIDDVKAAEELRYPAGQPGQWKHVFDGDRRSGQQLYGEQLADFTIGALISLAQSDANGKPINASYLTTPFGFIVAGRPDVHPASGLPLVGFARDGRLLWRAAIAVAAGRDVDLAQARVLKLKVDGPRLLIYVERQAERWRPVQVFQLQIPLRSIVAVR